MSSILKKAFGVLDLPEEYHVLSDYTVYAIRAYAFEREPGSHFIEAVMSNDLQEAFARADDINQRTMPQIVRLVYNHCPSDCWGSKEKYEAWLGSTYIDVAMKGKPGTTLLVPISIARATEKPGLVDLWLAANMPEDYQDSVEEVVWSLADGRVLGG